MDALPDDVEALKRMVLAAQKDRDDAVKIAEDAIKAAVDVLRTNNRYDDCVYLSNILNKFYEHHRAPCIRAQVGREHSGQGCVSACTATQWCDVRGQLDIRGKSRCRSNQTVLWDPIRGQGIHESVPSSNPLKGLRNLAIQVHLIIALSHM
eukprot:361291-Chlamydomonas_euryale.AAC.4